jgi:Flp pilus assembly protein TadB
LAVVVLEQPVNQLVLLKMEAILFLVLLLQPVVVLVGLILVTILLVAVLAVEQNLLVHQQKALALQIKDMPEVQQQVVQPLGKGVAVVEALAQ